jgi:ELWxxDGT repeat protein
LTVVGTTLYFSAGNGTELWRSNGTTAGTSLISSLGTDANISNLIAFGSRVYFTATDAINGSELWVSDGTSAGTQRVTNINPTGSSDPNNLVILGNTLYFFANTGTNYELWQVTSTGTASRVQVIQPSSELGPDLLTVVGSTLYFVVDSGIVGAQDRELWRSDGTTSGTVPLGADINLSGDDEISELTNVNGTLFFTANDGTGARLWQSNGTVAGTIPVSQGYAVPPSGLTTAGNALFFAAGTVNQGIELWRL